MQILKIIGAGLLIVMGVVWTLQGFGASYVPTSFMTRAPEWILIGAITAAAGISLLVRIVRKP